MEKMADVEPEARPRDRGAVSRQASADVASVSQFFFTLISVSILSDFRGIFCLV